MRPLCGNEAGDRVDEGRLARAVRPDQADELPLPHLEIDVDHGVHTAEADRDAGRVQDRLAARLARGHAASESPAGLGTAVRLRPRSHGELRARRRGALVQPTSVSLRLAAQLARRAAVGRPEDTAEMLRAGEPPTRRDRQDRLMRERGIHQIAPAAVEASRTDPAAHARPLRLEELVEVPPGDEARPRDLLRREVGISEVRLDERLDREQDLGARP